MLSLPNYIRLKLFPDEGTVPVPNGSLTESVSLESVNLLVNPRVITSAYRN